MKIQDVLTKVTGIQYDSRLVQPGYLFIAVPGEKSDGRQYIQNALNKGASVVLYESRGIEKFELPETGIPLIPVDDLITKQGRIAAEFFGNPSSNLNVIGVTGTNGKTSITYFLAQCLENSAVIGTTGYGTLGALKKLNYTTPMAVDVQRMLAEFLNEKCQVVAMEVSSHGLEQHRIEGVEFNTAVFTNLTRDHLDYHGDMYAYAEAKKKLFRRPSLKYAVINLDDPVGRDIAQEISAKVQVLGYSLNAHSGAQVYLHTITCLSEGFLCDISMPSGRATIKLPLLGRFNVANALAVIGVLSCLELSSAEITQRVSSLHCPPGRMEIFHRPPWATVIVDFAHTPDALEKALVAVREHCSGRLYCVFGCGGDRDVGKRPMMGKIASELSDEVIITNDNPRHEDPSHIADQIMAGISKGASCSVILDRRTAIIAALKKARSDDVILIAGKGHENFQIIGDTLLHFNDSEVVAEVVELLNETI